MENFEMWTAASLQVLDTIGEGLALFLQTPTVYFTALAFTGACIGVARKLIPMRRR